GEGRLAAVIGQRDGRKSNGAEHPQHGPGKGQERTAIHGGSRQHNFRARRLDGRGGEGSTGGCSAAAMGKCRCADRRGQDRSKKQGRPGGRPSCSTPAFLDGLNVLSLEALRSLGHAELHGLAFLEGAEAARLDGREVHENVFAALARDETVTLGVVEPLYCSLFHCFSFLYWILRCSDRAKGRVAQQVSAFA